MLHSSNGYAIGATYFNNGSTRSSQQGGGVLRQQAAAWLRRGLADHLRLSRLHLFRRCGRHRALLTDWQLAHLPRGGG
eukprot:2888249-Pleurochrysis_carterae.AAC.1